MLVLYLCVIFAFIGDVLIFKVSFGGLEILGASIVTVSTCATIIHSLYTKKDEKKTEDSAISDPVQGK